MVRDGLYGSNEASLVRSWRMTLRLRYLLLAGGVLALANQGLAQECEGWDTQWFFRSASLARVVDCLEAGSNVNARVVGRTPLHWAVTYDADLRIIEALVDAGADASARDDEGNTPWDYAQDNEVLRGTDAWWRLNEGRFRSRSHLLVALSLPDRPEKGAVVNMDDVPSLALGVALHGHGLALA